MDLELVLLCVLVLSLELVYCQYYCSSPGVFNFEGDAGNMFGKIVLQSTEPVSTLVIRINFSIGTQPDNYEGHIEAEVEDGNLLVQKYNRGEAVTYRVHFPVTSPLPKLNTLMVNGNTLCYTPADSPKPNSNSKTISLHHFSFLKSGSLIMHSAVRPEPQPQPKPQPQPQRKPEPLQLHINNYGNDGTSQIILSNIEPSWSAVNTSLPFTQPVNRPPAQQNFQPSRPVFNENQPEPYDIYTPKPGERPVSRPNRPVYDQVQTRPVYQSPETRPQSRPDPDEDLDYPDQVTARPRPIAAKRPVYEQVTKRPVYKPPEARPQNKPDPDEEFEYPDSVAPQPRPLNRQPDKLITLNECGKIAGSNDDVSFISSNGSYPRGSLPWLVALYKVEGGILRYICGGTLISNQHVITAGHCLEGRSQRTDIKDIVVKVGVHNLNDWGDEITVNSKIKSAVIHEDFDSVSLKNDIMVMTLNKPVKFNTFIRPACLWNGNTHLAQIVGFTGVVAGWGERAGYGTVGWIDEPNKKRIPVVSTATCRASNPGFHKITSNTTFCAGSRDGSGVCTGYSGSGLYMQEGGQWRVRGIVSVSLRGENGDTSCDLYEYIVFTDIAQYLPWIRSVMSGHHTALPINRQPDNTITTVECGTIVGGNENIPLIYNGDSYERGELPWLVAIYRRKMGTLLLICGGTLISNRHVITTGNCLHSGSSRTANEDIVVKVGVHALNDWSDENTVTRTVFAVDLHDNFDAVRLKNDIGIITFNKPVEFNTYIRPACLWNGNTDLSRIVGAAGVVAGWGDQGPGGVGRQGVPKQVRLPIVSTTTCRASNPMFFQLTSETSFCAGSRDGSGPCVGDSGGGLYLLENGKWRVRGIVSVTLQAENGDTICNLDEYIVFTDVAQYLPWISVKTNVFAKMPINQPDITTVECGMIVGGNENIPLIYLGDSYGRGEMPWLVAIYKREVGTLKFICGGTLISNRHVITTGNCLHSGSSRTANEDIVVKVGVHALNDWSDQNTVTRTVFAVDLHDNFDAVRLKNDIGIITFNKPVEFNTFIRPACLWNGNTDLSRIVGAAGVVAGWGDQDPGGGGRQGVPKQVRLPIVSTTTCRASNPMFFQLTSETSFCAGSRDGSGPCVGDSGGGLYLLENGKWRVRGIVSVTLREEDGDTICNLDEYIVFTDVAQYLPWISVKTNVFVKMPINQPDITTVECGTIVGGNENIPLIYHGVSYGRGEMPWLVAIYKREVATLRFICGGTLISNRHVITTGHCLHSRSSRTANEDIVVKVGVHALNDWSDENTVTRTVFAVDLNDNFDAVRLKNNIGIITFNKPVEFNTFIRPACLWNGNTDLSRIVGAAGVVAGWGDQGPGGEGRQGVPKQVRLPIVSTTTCRASNPSFRRLTSETTICAGSRDGSGPCVGDSGGGLYLLENGKWRVRGIVSISLLGENEDSSCNLDEYIVFTDVAQFLPWIRRKLSL